ncbi:MAG: hypothetical protein V4598_02855 [Bdellovibrionota bacterium]
MLLLLVVLAICPQVWAAQEAIVIADRAVIYADKTMSSPVGYVLRGKRVTIGEIPRNKARLYPIIVSGKIAYIRVTDVSTEMESLDSNRLVAERFLRAAGKKLTSHYGVSVYTFPSQISMNKSFDELEDKDAFVWNGFQVKGATRTSTSWDVGFVMGYAEGKENVEAFRMVEIGPDLSYRIYTGDFFILRWQNQLMGVPFATYSLGSKARVNGYGFSAGTNLGANWILGDRLGFEAYGGVYYTKLFGFDLPDPANAGTNLNRPDIRLNPSFVGTRVGIGFTYQI